MQNFRTAFPAVNRELLNWFPGHMGKGLKQMQQKLKSVDCVVEVHDARIPFSGRNDEFKYTISGIKPHILVLNKKDLIHKTLRHKIIDKLKSNDPDLKGILFTNAKDAQCDGVRKIMPKALDLIAGSNRFNRSESTEACIMVIGVPNVGKSSIINALRNRHLNKKSASQVGAIAGITRSVLNRIKINEDPAVYLLDTPGILVPNIGNNEVGLRLALVSCLQDHLVGPDVIADYLLFIMNQMKNFKYVEVMGLSEPSDEISQVLLSGAKKLNKYLRRKNYDNQTVLMPDIETAAYYMIKHFRTGTFGKILVDYDKL